MKRETPELYDVHVTAIQSQIKADEVARTAPYTEPAKAVGRGQLFGLLMVVATLVFCGYLAYLGHPISATVIAAINLVGLSGVFAGNNNDKK